MKQLKFDYTFAKYLYEKFKDILFDEETHSYTNLSTGNKLISVTQTLKLFEPKFDSDYWAGKKATEKGITKEEMLKQWDDIKKAGLERGNVYHNYIEKRHYRNQIQNVIPEIEQYLNSNNDIPLLSELVIGNDYIGGKLDHIALRDDHLIIKDWKSNAKFNIESPYKLINGLEHLPNTEYYKYALQVSLYKFILGLDDIKELEIVWFNNNSYTIYKVPYLENEVKHIYNYVSSRAYSGN